MADQSEFANPALDWQCGYCGTAVGAGARCPECREPTDRNVRRTLNGDHEFQCGCRLSRRIVNEERQFVVHACRATCPNVQLAVNMTRQAGKPVRYERG